MNSDEIKIHAIKTALVDAGNYSLEQRSYAISRIKTDGTPTTDIELEIERRIVDVLAAQFPGQPLLTEEQGNLGETGETNWILDPIDGTRVYLNGLPIWGVSLGRLVNGSADLGFLYLPRLGDLYWGGTEFGAWKNDQALPAIPPPDPADPLSFVMVSSNAHRQFKFSLPRIRAFGSVAAHLVYVAEGIAMGAVLNRAKLWDIAGVLPLLKSTGIAFEYFSGARVDFQEMLHGEEIREPVLAAHRSVLEYLRTHITRIK